MGKKLLVGGLIISLIFILVSCASLSNYNVESRWKSSDGQILQYYSRNGRLQSCKTATLVCKADKTWTMKMEIEIMSMGKPEISIATDRGNFSGDSTKDSTLFFETKMRGIDGHMFTVKDNYFNKNFTATVEGEKIIFTWEEPNVEVEPLPAFVLTRVSK